MLEEKERQKKEDTEKKEQRRHKREEKKQLKAEIEGCKHAQEEKAKRKQVEQEKQAAEDAAGSDCSNGICDHNRARKWQANLTINLLVLIVPNLSVLTWLYVGFQKVCGHLAIQ